MHTQAREICRVMIYPGWAESDLARRIRGEFREMPGMRITPQQARRLWSLDGGTCESVLETLVSDGFLARDASGRYMKAHGGY
jgi:hypothetical protein